MRLSEDAWDALGEQYGLAGADPLKSVLGALLDLREELEQLRRAAAGTEEAGNFEAREAALKAAREHVGTLPSEAVNSRGYADHALKAGERTALELQVARFLLGSERSRG